MADARFTSQDAYRQYQRKIAHEALLPILSLGGMALGGRRLLDVGCGTGGMTAVWQGEGARAVGVEIDAERLSGLAGEFVAGDVMRLPFRDDSFDLVFAHDCLEHVAALDVALGEIARVLAPGAVSFVTFPPFYSPYGGHQQGSRSWVKLFPYGHLLPERLWLALARRERYRAMFRGLSRLSMGRFERVAVDAGLVVTRRLAYVVRPEVAYRAGVPAIGAPIVGAIPAIRELLVGGAFYFLRKPGGRPGATGEVTNHA